ncbi:MAG: flagellin [Vampirovibrionales bacterium]|nr:flagellin [Vampirovibrionales bacterium]
MPLVVNTNVSSINAQRNLTNNVMSLSKSMEKLSSGYRINKAGDDAAGLTISENLRAQIRGSKKAIDNVQDGINVLNITDAALSGISNNLQRMRELAVQAGNDTNSAASRTAMKTEFDALGTEITRISDSTNFNGVQLLDGTTASINIQLGPGSAAASNVLNIASFGDIDAAALGVATGATPMATNANAIATIALVDTAITTVNTRRSGIGAVANRLENAASNLMSSVENLSAAESRIRDVDVAAESSNLVRNQVLQQASAAMLSQANQQPSIALSLLK